MLIKFFVNFHQVYGRRHCQGLSREMSRKSHWQSCSISSIYNILDENEITLFYIFIIKKKQLKYKILFYKMKCYKYLSTDVSGAVNGNAEQASHFCQCIKSNSEKSCQFMRNLSLTAEVPGMLENCSHKTAATASGLLLKYLQLNMKIK